MPNPPTYRTTKNGARLILRLSRYEETHPQARLATCGSCERTWDDAHVSGVTPAPASLCPFCNA